MAKEGRSKRQTDVPVNSRERIIQAAKTVFLRHGYKGSLDEVAREAGVGRRTVYNQFESKDALLRAMIEALSESLIVPLFNGISDELEIRSYLLLAAQRYVDLIMSEESLQTYRFFVADLYRHPDLVGLVYTSGFEMSAMELAKVLDVHMSAGRLRRVDVKLASERFLSSVIGSARHRAILGLGTDTPAQQKISIEAAVDHFIHGLVIAR